jgi:hypothetical protein
MGTITEPDDKTHYNDDVSDMIVKEFMRVFAWKSETYGR